MKTEIDKELFKSLVFQTVKLIPKGRATSYGKIAKAIGYPNYSRLVGKVLANSSSETDNIPAHRVVNSQGLLSGSKAFKHPNYMKDILESEGIKIINNKIVDWKIVLWDPIEEIDSAFEE